MVRAQGSLHNAPFSAARSLVETGIGMYAVFALMVFIPAILVTFDARELWGRVAWVDGTMSRHPPDGVPVAEARR